MERSELILKAFDGTLKRLAVTAKDGERQVEFQIEIYNGDYILESATLLFTHVQALDFSLNYFDENIGAELGGFYEIFSSAEKRERIERNFVERREGYLLHGDYAYDPEDIYELLNNRRGIYEVVRRLEQYHLYQLQTTGGVYYVLAAAYRLISD